MTTPTELREASPQTEVVVGGEPGEPGGPGGPGQPEPPAWEGRPGQPGQRANVAALVRLALVVSAIVALFVAVGQTNLLIVIVAVIVMVMVHELGHLVAAKRSHMKVTEYFVGFGPRLWSIRRGETEYGIKAIPAGGYVKIPGMTNLEEVAPEDEPRTYRQQPFHNRLAVAVAGSFMHFVMALVLAWVALVFIGSPSASQVSVSGFVHWQGHAQTAAQIAGLRTGDRIVSINGHPVNGSQGLESTIRNSAGKPVTLVVDRGGRQLTLQVTPVDGRTLSGGRESVSSSSGHPVGLIGVELGSPSVPENPISAVGSSFVTIGRVTSGEVTGLGQVFSPHGISSYVSQVSNSQVAARDAKNGTARLQSIVGVVNTATQGAQAGTFYLLEVLVILNIVIGLVNLFPMLPLDGGHVAIAVYERIRSRRGRPYHADAAKLMPVAYAMVALLVVLFTTTLYLDLTHPVANPFHG